MPKTLINEIDNTSGEISSGLTNTVYIPCYAVRELMLVPTGQTVATRHVLSGLANDAHEEDLLPHLLTTPAQLADLVESISGVYTEPEEGGDSQNVPLRPDTSSMSYSLAHYLLGNGFQVVFQIVVTNTAEAWARRFTELQDKSLYDIKFITLGEFAEGGLYSLSDVIGCAEKRGDCIALIDHPQQIPDSYKKSGEKYVDYSTMVHRWIEANAVGSYVATFSPWCSNTMHYIVGTNDAKIYPLLPPSFSFLAAYANAIKTNASWLAAAGAGRGFIPGLIKVGKKYGERDIDTLQCREVTYSGGEEAFGDKDNVGVACNPICNIDPFGVIIWGNRTGLNNAGSLKATSLLNIRNLACDVKKTMWKAARRYTFEQNTLRLWLNFCSQIRPLLDRAKAGEGIESYKFIQEETGARARLKARVVIVPIDAVEDFELSFVLDDTIETEESAG